MMHAFTQYGKNFELRVDLTDFEGNSAYALYECVKTVFKSAVLNAVFGSTS